jgi:hypothetical protein
LKEVFLSKTISTLMGKQCARCHSFYHRWFSWRDTCISSITAEYTFLSK